MGAVGILFDIDALGGGFYGETAWRILMKYISPSRLVGCSVREGDTSATLARRANEFCIALDGMSLDVAYVKTALANADDKGLLPPSRRFLETRLEAEPFVDVGMVDAAGRFTEPSWSRIWHDRCRDAGWGYKPRSVPKDLSPELRAELDVLMGAGGASGSRKWWQFWK